MHVKNSRWEFKKKRKTLTQFKATYFENFAIGSLTCPCNIKKKCTFSPHEFKLFYTTDNSNVFWCLVSSNFLIIFSWITSLFKKKKKNTCCKLRGLMVKSPFVVHIKIHLISSHQWLSALQIGRYWVCLLVESYQPNQLQPDPVKMKTTFYCIYCMLTDQFDLIRLIITG